MTDFANNIHLFNSLSIEGVSPLFTIYNAHAKIISDIEFLVIPTDFDTKTANREKSNSSEEEKYQIFMASCSFDGYLKVWDFKDMFRPIYEHFSSKKWVQTLKYDPSTLALYCNGEGKHFP